MIVRSWTHRTSLHSILRRQLDKPLLKWHETWLRRTMICIPRILLALLLLAACSGTSSPSSSLTDAALSDASPAQSDSMSQTTGALTHGMKGEGELCKRHFECKAEHWCTPAGKCTALATIGMLECKANQDCGEGRVCDQRTTSCHVGKCGHDLDCAPPTPDCDLNGLRGAPYVCTK
jgi:hypothetical protein